MFKNNNISLLKISIAINIVLLLVVGILIFQEQISNIINNNRTPTISYALSDPEIFQYISNDFSYQIKMFKNWVTEDSQDGNVAFRPGSIDRYILNIFNEKSDLTPRQWYINRFHSQKGTETDLTVNGYLTFKNEYSENGYDYIDYIIKVGESMVYFHFTLNDGTYDNTEFKVYFENIVYSVQEI